RNIPPGISHARSAFRDRADDRREYRAPGARGTICGRDRTQGGVAPVRRGAPVLPQLRDSRDFSRIAPVNPVRFMRDLLDNSWQRMSGYVATCRLHTPRKCLEISKWDWWSREESNP